MPQFDVFIFLSSVFYLIIGFFGLMFYNQLVFLPKVSGILKLREKIQSFKSEEFQKVESKNLLKISNSL